MSIAFTQYLRPFGRRQSVSIDVPAEVEALASRLIAAGYVFEVEVLRTGHVSMDCSRPGDDEPVAHEVVENGQNVPNAVARLVHDAARCALRATN